MNLFLVCILYFKGFYLFAGGEGGRKNRNIIDQLPHAAPPSGGLVTRLLAAPRCWSRPCLPFPRGTQAPAIPCSGPAWLRSPSLPRKPGSPASAGLAVNEASPRFQEPVTQTVQVPLQPSCVPLHPVPTRPSGGHSRLRRVQCWSLCTRTDACLPRLSAATAPRVPVSGCPFTCVGLASAGSALPPLPLPVLAAAAVHPVPKGPCQTAHPDSWLFSWGGLWTSQRRVAAPQGWDATLSSPASLPQQRHVGETDRWRAGPS